MGIWHHTVTYSLQLIEFYLNNHITKIHDGWLYDILFACTFNPLNVFEFWRMSISVILPSTIL